MSTDDALTRELRKAEASYRRGAQRADTLRQHRNRLVHAALDAGWTHQRIADATGLTRGRVNQIAQAPRPKDTTP